MHQIYSLTLQCYDNIIYYCYYADLLAFGLHFLLTWLWSDLLNRGQSRVEFFPEKNEFRKNFWKFRIFPHGSIVDIFRKKWFFRNFSLKGSALGQNLRRLAGTIAAFNHQINGHTSASGQPNGTLGKYKNFLLERENWKNWSREAG